MSADTVFNLPALKDALLAAEQAKFHILALAGACHARADHPSEEEFRDWLFEAVIARSAFACAEKAMYAAEEALRKAKKEIYS